MFTQFKFHFVSALVFFTLISVVHGKAGTLVVANKSSLSLSFINDVTLRKMGELKIGTRKEDTPHEVAMNPSGKLALVSHYGSVQLNPRTFEFDNSKHPGSALSLIDVARGKLIRKIELPKKSSPHGIQFLSDTIALVTLEGIQSLGIVDISNELNPNVETFPIPGRGAHMIAVDHNKRFAYIANKDSGSVVQFDLLALQAVNERTIGKHAEGITLTANDSEVLVTNRIANTVTFLDSQTLAIQAQLKTECGPIRIALFDHGRTAILTNLMSGTAQILDLPSRRLSPGFKTTHRFNIRTGKFFEGLFGILHLPITLLVNDEMKTAFIANSYAGNITRIDLMSGRVLNTFLAGKEPDGMADSSVAFQGSEFQ